MNIKWLLYLTCFDVIIAKKVGAGDHVFKIDTRGKNANIPRTIRFTEELFERLGNIAQDKGISFNYLVLQCCEYALDNLETADREEK